MTPSSVHDIRNLALLGHAGSGKTTLVEALLAAAGEIGAAGSVERGDTVADFDPQEKAMCHSLHAALVHLEWAGHWINLLDTPGLPDLSGRALVALRSHSPVAICRDTPCLATNRDGGTRWCGGERGGAVAANDGRAGANDDPRARDA